MVLVLLLQIAAGSTTWDYEVFLMKRTTPAVLRYLCLTDVLYELIRTAPSPVTKYP